MNFPFFSQKIKFSKLPLFVLIGGLSFLISIISKNLFLSDYWGTFLIMGLFLLIILIPLILSLFEGKFDPFEPVYLWIIIYGYLYLAKPFVQIINNQAFSYGAYNYGNTNLNIALLLALLGLICFYIGYYGNFGKKISNYLPVITSEISSKKLTIIAWGFIIIGFLGLNHYIQISGGWKIFWSKPHGLGGLAIKSTAYIYELPELMVIGFILISEIFMHKIIIEKKKIRLINIINLIFAAIGGVGIYTIIWGSRTYSSWIILAIVILYFLKKQSRPALKTSIMAIFMLFLILSFIPIYRQYMHLGSDLSKIAANIDFQKIINVAFNHNDEFNVYLAETTLVPDSVPYDYFNLYFRTLVHPIPRIIWPTKPAFLNSQWDDFLSKSGISWGSAESMLGDFYAQAGILGIIIGTFFSGILWKTFYQYLMKYSANRSVVLIYAVIFPNMFTYIAQSALIGFLKWAPYMVPSTIIALFLSRRKIKS